MASGILVIRGGAIGDFILTLPAIGLLREAFPQTRLEILGYKHIVALAEGRYYADATRSIEYGGMASFFVPGGKLPEELVAYFSQFAQVISYLYDPDGFFEENLRRAGVKNYLAAYARLDDSAHAARQLARPMERLALFLENEEATVHPTAEDRARAAAFLEGADGRPVIAFHPGSGGERKLWPLPEWQTLLCELRRLYSEALLLMVGGEADRERIAALQNEGIWRQAVDLPLPDLAAILEKAALYVGHDSGISHLAAAVKTPSVVLFGPTEPAVWAPAGAHVHVLRGENGDFRSLPAKTVLAQISKILIPS